MRLTWLQMLLIVLAGAMVGLILDGLLGLAAGVCWPEIVVNITSWRKVEPVRFATGWGAILGVMLGGGLGSFGVLVHLVLERLHTDPGNG